MEKETEAEIAMQALLISYALVMVQVAEKERSLCMKVDQMRKKVLN